MSHIDFINHFFQGNFCLDSGAYIANLECCQNCGLKDTLKIANESQSSSNSQQDSEIVEYDRMLFSFK